jgi:hypothetical protein
MSETKFELNRLSHANGEWTNLLQQWERDCALFNENFEEYAAASMSVLRPLAEQTQVTQYGVFGLKDETGYIGACQLNGAYLPGYDDKVLRVRHIVHAPIFDFKEDFDVDDYVKFLGGLFVSVFNASVTEIPCPYVKFHFQSPAERAFFESMTSKLSEIDSFAEVKMVGSWLYIKRAQADLSANMTLRTDT